MEIRFTKHARTKFAVLRRHGMSISRANVLDTVRKPQYIDDSRAPLRIAQSTLDKNRVLRVVYRVEKEYVVVITFYPGRRSQYEK